MRGEIRIDAPFHRLQAAVLLATSSNLGGGTVCRSVVLLDNSGAHPRHRACCFCEHFHDFVSRESGLMVSLRVSGPEHENR